MKKILLFSLLLSLATKQINAQVNVQDSLALVDLYNSTNGPGWSPYYSSWLNGPVSSWEGVFLRDTRVVLLFLEQANLNGPLPASLLLLVK